MPKYVRMRGSSRLDIHTCTSAFEEMIKKGVMVEIPDQEGDEIIAEISRTAGQRISNPIIQKQVEEEIAKITPPKVEVVEEESVEVTPAEDVVVESIPDEVVTPPVSEPSTEDLPPVVDEKPIVFSSKAPTKAKGKK